MKQNRFSRIAIVLAVPVLSIAACNNNRENSTDAGPGTGNDTSLTDTRRNSTDTTNYITKDSGNKSQDVIDMNPPQNSRY